MRSVTYSMGVSLDGYIVGPDGDFDWTAPDEEVFRFVTDEIREVGVHLLGRRLYETMLYGRPQTRIHRSTTQWSSGPRSGSRSPRWCSPPRCRRCRARRTTLLHSLVCNHALVDGNKRLGLLATVVFLRLNGLDLDLTDDEAFDLTTSVAAGQSSADDIEKRLRTRPAQR